MMMTVRAVVVLFQGELIDSVSHLVGLREVDLSHNRLNGALHQWLASLHNLRVMIRNHRDLSRRRYGSRVFGVISWLI
jgi:predicted transcriptional regulator